MPITLITGPANAGKAQLAMEAVKRHVAHGREPLLVVPTRADFVAELEVRRIDPGRLNRALSIWRAADGDGASRTELGQLFGAYREALERLGRLDGEQRAVRALDALRRQPALWGGTPVLFYGFDDLTRLQLDAIETLGRIVGAEVTVSLAYEPGRTAFAARPAGTSFDLLEEVFAAAGVPFTLQRRRHFGDTATGRALIGLLRCVPGPDGSSRGEYGDLLAWLRAPGLHERAGLADWLENKARRTGSVGAAQARAL